MRRPSLVSDIVRACSLERAAAAVDAAMQAIIQMATLPELQALLLKEAALGYLIPLLLTYDSTLGGEAEAEEGAAVQQLATDASSVGPAHLDLSMQTYQYAGMRLAAVMGCGTCTA